MKDLLLDTDFDIRIANGDFVGGESTQQHQWLLLMTEKGELREFPTTGIGSQSWLNDDFNFGDLNAEVKRQFEADGMRVLSVKGKGQKLEIEAYYEQSDS